MEKLEEFLERPEFREILEEYVKAKNKYEEAIEKKNVSDKVFYGSKIFTLAGRIGKFLIDLVFE
jgi:hypothetical protein